MKRHALRVAIVAALIALGGVLALVVIGRKVEHRTVHKPLAPALVAPVQSCPGDQATMSCILQHQAPPAATAQSLHTPGAGHAGAVTVTSTTAAFSPELSIGYRAAAATTSIYGVDFGWSTMSAAGLKSIGARFAASYLSPDISKNWTLAAVNADHAAGIATVAVWEATATRSEEGYAAGVADAHQAAAQAAALGNTTETIDFAVDCDCAVSSITGYFQGVHSVLGARAGIYGGYDQVAGIHALGLVGDQNWQTYAWSGGRWLPAAIAPLEQYLNGSAYDNDRAIAANYGQWPAATPPKPVNPHHYRWLPDTRRALHAHGRVVHARERSAARTWDAHHCALPARRAVCREMHQHLQLLAARDSFIAHHTGRHLRHVARRPRWDALHYRAGEHRTTLGGAFRQLHRRLVKSGRVTAW